MARRALFLALLAAVALGLPACGSVDEAGSPGDGALPPSTELPETRPADTGFTETGGSEPATTSVEPSPGPPDIAPPPMVLESRAGDQKGVQESYCVTDPDAGVGICGDTPDLLPERLSVVRPGEAIRISLKGMPAARLSVSARPLGCLDRDLVPIELTDGGWAVDLEGGAYELQAFAQFAKEEGPSGDSAASFGLLVDPTAELAIVEATPDRFACPPPDLG